MKQSRLPDVGTSIFTVMSALAQEHQAINLSQGFPDFPIDPEIIELVHRFMRDGYNQYAPMAGALPLREAIAGMVAKSYGRQLNPASEVVVTAGATEGLYASIAAFVHPGDEVIIFDPSYDSYDPAIRLNGGVPVRIKLTFPDFRIDWEKLEHALSPRTRMIIVNSPHNPSGAVLTGEDMQRLATIVLSRDLILLSDEVYDRLIFDGHAHQSVLKYPELSQNTLAVFSFGKTFHATGWKVGFVAGEASLLDEVRKTHQFVVFSVHTPTQLALAEYLRQPSRYEDLGNFYQKKRDFFLGQMQGSRFSPLLCSGSYFQLMSYEAISELPDAEMARWLTTTHKVAAIPVSVFYQDGTDNHVLRFCFAKQEQTLEKACAVLRTI